MTRFTIEIVCQKFRQIEGTTYICTAKQERKQTFTNFLSFLVLIDFLLNSYPKLGKRNKKTFIAFWAVLASLEPLTSEISLPSDEASLIALFWVVLVWLLLLVAPHSMLIVFHYYDDVKFCWCGNDKCERNCLKPFQSWVGVIRNVSDTW